MRPPCRPVYNQDDGQLVKGVSFGAMGRITDRWDLMANIGYLDSEQQSQNVVNNGKQSDADAGMGEQHLDDVSIPDRPVGRRRRAAHRRGLDQRGEHRFSRPATTWSTRWPSMR